MSNSAKQPDSLISVLLDLAAPLGDRDDAAMDLGAFDEPSAEDALLKIVTTLTEDDVLIDSAGESLWEIWNRQEKFDATLVAQMHPEARKFFSRDRNA